MAHVILTDNGDNELHYDEDGNFIKKQSSYGSGGWYFFAIPVAVTTFLVLLAAWFAARHRASYNVLRMITFPATFIWSNIIGMSVLFAVYFIGGVAGYKLTYDLSDLSMFWLFKPLLVNFWHIILPGVVKTGMAFSDPENNLNQHSMLTILLYQVGLYFVLGRHLNNMIAKCFYLYGHGTLPVEPVKKVKVEKLYTDRFIKNRAIITKTVAYGAFFIGLPTAIYVHVVPYL